MDSEDFYAVTPISLFLCGVIYFFKGPSFQELTREILIIGSGALKPLELLVSNLPVWALY